MDIEHKTIYFTQKHNNVAGTLPTYKLYLIHHDL